MTKEQYSPSTQAVSDAADKVRRAWGNMCPADAHTIAAAALRAAAEQVRYKGELGMTAYGGHAQALRQILDIATELEETK
jgi:hypothetical protein